MKLLVWNFEKCKKKSEGLCSGGRAAARPLRIRLATKKGDTGGQTRILNGTHCCLFAPSVRFRLEYGPIVTHARYNQKRAFASRCVKLWPCVWHQFAVAAVVEVRVVQRERLPYQTGSDATYVRGLNQDILISEILISEKSFTTGQV